MKVIKFLFSSVFMGMLFILFAVAMAVATFVENDYGSAAAYSMIYNKWWFELVLLLLAVNLIGQMIIFKLYKRDKLPVFFFHLSFVVMIIGAGITRYFGWEGSIHIREGQEQNKVYSNDKYISYSVKDASGKILNSNSEKYTMSSASAENFKKSIDADGKEYEILLARIIPNAVESIAESPNGEPIISFMVTKDMMNQETVILKKGDNKSAMGLSFGFGSDQPSDIRIFIDSSSFFFSSDSVLQEMSMMSHETSHQFSSFAVNEKVKLKPMQVISHGEIKIVPKEMALSGAFRALAVSPSEQNTGQNAFVFHVFHGKESGMITLWDRNSENSSSGSCMVNDNTFEIAYGSKVTTLPFTLKLNDFILDRYPGSTSPSGYKSDVLLRDEAANVEMPFVVFMNNILKYRGYRFYQSSYDPDERGTVLSVNHDFAGMVVTYTGYAIMILFIILSLVIKNSVFRKITAGNWSSNLRKTSILFLLIFIISGLSANAQKFIPEKKASEEFGKVLVQDQKGRTKPLFTLSSDILRKVARENELDGMSSMQVFMGIYLDFENWKDFPMIKISNGDLRKELGIRGDMASFSDLVDLEGTGNYKLGDKVSAAYAKAPGERDKMDKEIMKVDERVNIFYMVYRGDFLKLFPLKDKTHNWGSADEALKTSVSKEDSTYLKSIMPLLSEAMQEGNALQVREISESLTSYQKRFALYDLPSDSKANIELLYYKMKIFEKLFPFYATTGLVMLIALIVMVIRGKKGASKFVQILGWLLLAGFVFHTLGLGMRWYIAGHSPMSNGYESMLFISWVTLLAGFIFSRKSPFALSSTAVLGAMTLMVAHLSFMDPEITNLVPVLKSYWLTLHVSVITGSYGFLGLGMILGLITMILMTLSNPGNQERISATIDELTVINFKTLTLGLYFLTIGTFLGAVWANESWGRYWGWDPKETWSLITIIVYSLVIHSRSIPGLKDIYTFNLLSLFAFASVLMTYFGVNYYLSGLHSYAAGDSVPVPAFVYISVILLAGLALTAYLKYTRPLKK